MVQTSLFLCALLTAMPSLAAAVYMGQISFVQYRFMSANPMPVSAGVLGGNFFSFLGGSFLVDDPDIVGSTVTGDGTPFVLGQVLMTNNRVEGAVNANQPFDLDLDIVLDLSTTDPFTFDDVVFQYTESVNVAGNPGCVTGTSNCPDTIKMKLPLATETIIIPISANEELELKFSVLGFSFVVPGGPGFDPTQIFPELKAGEGPAGAESAYIVAKLVATTKTTNTGGDPHFLTWGGESFDFHGECDLLYLHNPDFAHGLGMDIHIRTKMRRQWSFIDQAAIRIGSDILEVKGGEENLYWINGEANVELPTTLGGYQVKYHRVNSKQREFMIKLDEGQSLMVRTFKDFVAVNVQKGREEDFGTSSGMSGNYVTGARLARDGKTVLADPVAFGQEWQVQPAVDGQLFRELEGPQHPAEMCKMPTPLEAQERRRRLGESTAKLQNAEEACAHAKKDQVAFDNCVFDVLLTDDIEMAGAY